MTTMNIMKRRPCMNLTIAVLLVLFPVVGVAGQDEPPTDDSSASTDNSEAGEEIRSQLQQWRETLLYGINSEIVDLLPTLTDNRESDLAPEVIELFQSSNNSDVLVAAATYLREMELPDGHDRGKTIVRDEFTRGDELVTQVMLYLRETGASMDPETQEALLRIAEDRSTVVAIGAVRLMGAAGTPSSVLIDLYRSDELTDDVRGRILIELGERGDPEVYDFVTEIIREDEEARTNLQRFAVDTLGKLGDPRGLPTILAQFDSDDALTRAYAVSALTNFDTPESNEALISALRDEFWRVRVAALEAIKERNLTDAAPAVLYKARQDPERQVRLAAISTMARLDTADGWELLEERVLSDRTALEERSAILDVMMNERLGRSVDLILQVMEQEWDKENSRVLDVIGRIASRVEDQRIEPVAARLLDHPNYILQIYGARAVGRSRLPGLIPIVEARQSEGSHPALRSAAVRALEQLGPR